MNYHLKYRIRFGKAPNKKCYVWFYLNFPCYLSVFMSGFIFKPTFFRLERSYTPATVLYFGAAFVYIFFSSLVLPTADSPKRPLVFMYALNSLFFKFFSNYEKGPMLKTTNVFDY